MCLEWYWLIHFSLFHVNIITCTGINLLDKMCLLKEIQTYFSSTICFWYSSYSSLDIPSWAILLVVLVFSLGRSHWIWTADVSKRKVCYSFLFFSLNQALFWLQDWSIRVNPMRGFSVWQPCSCITKNILTMTLHGQKKSNHLLPNSISSSEPFVSIVRK